MSLKLYYTTSYRCSKLITQAYSTSFSLGIRLFKSAFRNPIYAVYGFVRYADEIVDTFHDFDKKALLDRFRQDTYRALEDRISLNPILNSFQEVVHKYSIDLELIDAFLDSMAMDLDDVTYDLAAYEKYIYGSAEVVGLMCLKIFTEGDEEEYRRLKDPARSLGAAFQKVNFLRDINSDFEERGRTYFPGVNFNEFTIEDKREIESDIRKDFDDAKIGIAQLPNGAKIGVYLAYIYYVNLFDKIARVPAARILTERIRIPNLTKILLLLRTYFMFRLRVI